MGKQKGRAFLLKIGDGQDPETFTNFAGMTGKNLKINNERIDVTTPDPAAPEGEYWRETLSGVKSVDVSGDITLVDEDAEARAVEIAMAAEPECNFQVVVPSIGTFQGAYSVSLEFGDDGKVTAALTLESTGAVTVTAAA